MSNIIELSEESKQEYLDHPHHCPVCGDHTVEADGPAWVEGTECMQRVNCRECGATWKDVYSLADITDIVVELKKETEVAL